ncbi:MAG: glycosyltransferase [Stenomitos rutilans HA7619-LM2]|nr:glycosyltransferase [Stenomitos rutilans HA7619-LM2]
MKPFVKPFVNDGVTNTIKTKMSDRALPSGASQRSTKPRLDGIQICRGIAALLVLLFHMTQLSQEKLGQSFLGNLFAFGSAGVDFFFVLSGFIIFFVHQADVGRRDRVQPFLLKRLIRIYPLYWLITVAILPIYFLLPKFGYGYERNLTVIVRSLLLIPQQHFPILIVGWSLSHEMLFYLLFALAIVFPVQHSIRLLSGWLFGTLILFLSNLLSLGNLEQYGFIQFLFNAHNLEFASGCLVASLVLQKRFREQKPFFLLFGTSLFLLFGIAQAERSVNFSPILAYGIPSTLIVLGVASLDLQRSHQPSNNRLLRFFTSLGDASYSIYLTHYLCLSLLLKLILATHLMQVIGYPATISLLLPITIGIGYLTYKWLEQPMTIGLRQILFSKTIVNPTAITTQPPNLASPTKAMKILFLDQSGELAGAELCLLDLVQPYRDRSLVCLFTDGPFRTTLEQQGISVKVLASQAIEVRKDSGLVRGLQSLSQLLPLAVIVSKLSRDYDVIYANTQKALIVGALASLVSHRPLVYHLHDILSIDHFSRTNRRLAVTLANRFARQIIATSSASRRAFIQAGGRANIVTVVYNGFEPAAYQEPSVDKTQLKQQLGLDGQYIVGHFSRLSPWKGQHILLEALVDCPTDVAAIFVGDALFGEQDYVQTLKAQVESLGLQSRVHFLGFRSDVIPLMHACDLVAHTSTAPEPFGRVIAEAMLCGKPVVASASGGAVELVEPGVTGWLVPPGDVKALAATIAHCRTQPNEVKTIAQTAQSTAAQRFDLNQIRQQIDHLLRNVVGF